MANPMIAVLKHYGVPVNRDEYLRTAYMGKPPAKLDPESEAELPQDDSRFMAYRPTTHEEVAQETAAKATKSTVKPKSKPVQSPDIYLGGTAKSPGATPPKVAPKPNVNELKGLEEIRPGLEQDMT